MAAITKTLIDEEALKILEKSKPFKFPEIEAKLHTETVDISIPFITNVRFRKDYLKNISDLVFLDFNIGLGTFLEVIYKNRDKIEVTIKIQYSKSEIYEKRFKGLILNKLPANNDTALTRSTREELDEQELVLIKLQLLDPLTIALKNFFITGIFHDLTLTDLLILTFGKRLADVTVLGRMLDYNLYIDKLDNDKVYDNIIIPPFTKLIKLPKNLHDGGYGIYKNDIGIYFNNNGVSNKGYQYDIEVYPLFKIKRFEELTDRPRLMLINPNTPNVSKNELDVYYKEGVYKTIVTEVTGDDDAERSRYSDGSGIIDAYANALDPTLLTVDEESVTLATDEMFDIIDYDPGLADYTKLINTNKDASIEKYISLLSRKQMVFLVFKLPNINPEFIIAGMPIKYLFMKDTVAYETTGEVLIVDIYYDNVKNINVTIIIAALQRIEEQA